MTHVPTFCKFLVLMPQWEFLNFLAEAGRRYPSFRLLMETTVTDLIIEDGVVRGVRTQTGDVPGEIRAELIVGADGRGSTVRAAAGLEVLESACRWTCCGCAYRGGPTIRPKSWAASTTAR